MTFALLMAIPAAGAVEPAPATACAGDTKIAPEAAAWQAMLDAPAEEQEAAAEDFADSIGAGLRTPTAGGGSACPKISGCLAGSCGGQTPCYRATEDVFDTGRTSCVLPSGTEAFCLPGQTIHIVTGSCSQCECCSGPPPNCPCPNNCGNYKSFRCQEGSPIE
jgi:hypothetical protein